MNDIIPVFVEYVPEHYESPLSITISCKESEHEEVRELLTKLQTIANIEFVRH